MGRVSHSIDARNSVSRPCESVLECERRSPADHRIGGALFWIRIDPVVVPSGWPLVSGPHLIPLVSSGVLVVPDSNLAVASIRFAPLYGLFGFRSPAIRAGDASSPGTANIPRPPASAMATINDVCMRTLHEQVGSHSLRSDRTVLIMVGLHQPDPRPRAVTITAQVEILFDWSVPNRSCL